jgi:6-aminohexanoate-oligomer endohydrolase
MRYAVAAAAIVLSTHAVLSQAVRSGSPTGGPSSSSAPHTPAPRTQFDGPLLEFDFPGLEIGVAEYDEGPTGVTVFAFPGRATAVVDVRGGAPGTTITDALRLGYDRANIDAIAFAGGSYYGLETAAAVAGRLRELRESSGSPIVAAVPGAIIFDLGNRRFNTLSPDRPLALAAFAAKRPNYFPLGARGAGRSARQGSFFGERLKSGQGAAYRQVGATKIAVFTVINAIGSIVDREGRVVRCNHPADAGIGHSIADHFAHYRPLTDNSRSPLADAHADGDVLATTNTTITLVVTNQKLTYGDLQRLALQVHTSMARGIQPFATSADGDALFAVSTQEVDNPSLRPNSLDVVAGEVAWDAILASVPAAPPAVQNVRAEPQLLDAFAGTYEFGTEAALVITRSANGLSAHAAGRRSIYEFPAGAAPSQLAQVSADEFQQDTRWKDRIKFTRAANGTVTGLILNPGLEHIMAKRVGSGQ